MTDTARPIGSGTVTLAVADGVATITLNRPEVLHAFNPAMGVDLLEAIMSADGDPAVRAVLLTGAGRAFMAGGDLSHLHDAKGPSARIGPISWLPPFTRSCWRWRGCPSRSSPA
ncbi:enoyl-CoA hydratase/isomerase family protein [Tistrella bauzanensis]